MQFFRRLNKAFKYVFGLREYKGAKRTRTSNWGTAFSPINKAIKSGIKGLRERARYLYKNNSYAKSYRLLDRANTIGHAGYILQNKAKLENSEDLDEAANSAIEEAWTEFGKKQYFTMAGRLDYVRASWVMKEQLTRDGEILARMITGPSVNKFGLSLELLETDDLAHDYNYVLRNGNAVIMGVEVNQWGRPVAYHIKRRDGNFYDQYSSNYYGQPETLVRVQAKNILHDFDYSHPKQMRGVSELSSAILDIKDLSGWEEAGLHNALWSAQQYAWMVRKRIEADKPFGEDEEDETEVDSDILSFEDGTIKELPFGYEMQTLKGEYPHQMHESFVKSHGRKIAASLPGANYNSLVGDLENVSYSALRDGKLSAQDEWKINQTLFNSAWNIPIFDRWLQMILFMGVIPYSYADISRLNKPHFQPRRWPWVDPLKDITASKIAIASGLSTITYELQKQGIDFNDYLKTRKRELELLKSNGLTIASDGTTIELLDETQSDDGNKSIFKIKTGT